MRKQFVKSSIKIASENEKLVILAGDIGVYGFRQFKEMFPKRYYNIGICEQTIIGIASGLSMFGFYPVMHSITPFIVERCFEQIKDDFYYQKLGATIVSVGGTFDYSSLGCTHHSYSDIGLFRTLPNAEIFTPCDIDEFARIYKTVYNNNKLTYIRLTENNIKFPNKLESNIYKGIRISSGNDISLFVAGPQLKNALSVLELSKKRDISIDLCYFSCLNPVDIQLVVESARKTKKVITLEENLITTSFGSIISSILDKFDNIAIHRIGIKDFVRDYGTYSELLQLEGLTDKKIMQEIEVLLDEQNH